MKKITLLLFSIFSSILFAQKPCETNPKYNEFDFWIGDWTVYNTQNKVAGFSKISKILKNCVILEEWTSASQLKNGMTYAGKSYNTFDANSGEWQQTWVDNVGGSTEFLHGKYENNALTFITDLFKIDSVNYVKRRLTFYNLDKNKVRQHGEISTDKGKTWKTEYDLEYRRNITFSENIVTDLFQKLENAYSQKDFKTISKLYTKNGKIIGPGTFVENEISLENYWKKLIELGGNWKLQTEKIETIENSFWIKGTSTITDKNNKVHKVNFTLILVQEDNTWKIFQDTYW